MRSWVFLLASALAAAACGPEPAPEAAPPADPEVVAVYRDGRVTAADLDRAILEQPASLRRPGPEETPAAWREGLVRELVIDRLLGAEAELLQSADDPEVAAMRLESDRQAVVDIWLERHPPAVEEVTEADVRRYYELHRDDYDRAGRRLVSHLFKRQPPEGDLSPVSEEIAALRRRVVAGESFADLAAEHSDSESRHRDGSLGWVSREELAPQLAEVIFSLPEGVPSEPLTTAEGVHLFQVDKIVEAKRFAFDEVAGMIRSQLERERGREAIDRLTADRPLPEGSFVAGSEELEAIFAAGDPAAVVLRAGDYELTAARLRGMLERRQEAGQPPPGEQAPELLRTLERRERIYLRATAEGLAADPEVQARQRRLAERDLLAILRQRSLRRKLAAEPERLQQYYDNNRLRFSSPLRLEVRLLTVPAAGAPADRAMARLERAAGKTGEPAERLSRLAAELGGEVEELGWRTLGELARLDPRWAGLAADLEPGELSPPLFAAPALRMLAVTDRREPEPLPFATVLERVREAYLAAHQQELYREWADATLRAAGLEIFRDRLERRPGPPPS